LVDLNFVVSLFFYNFSFKVDLQARYYGSFLEYM